MHGPELFQTNQTEDKNFLWIVDRVPELSFN